MDTIMDRNKLHSELIYDEGISLKPYRDSVGKLTIGVGRNLDDKGISDDEAMYLLDNDINEALRDARTFVWFDDLTDARQRVVVNMIFNLGLTRFSNFKKTIHHIAAGEYDKAAVEMLDSRWARQVGSRAKRLAKMMKEG